MAEWREFWNKSISQQNPPASHQSFKPATQIRNEKPKTKTSKLWDGITQEFKRNLWGKKKKQKDSWNKHSVLKVRPYN